LTCRHFHCQQTHLVTLRWPIVLPPLQTSHRAILVFSCLTHFEVFHTLRVLLLFVFHADTGEYRFFLECYSGFFLKWCPLTVNSVAAVCFLRFISQPGWPRTWLLGWFSCKVFASGKKPACNPVWTPVNSRLPPPRVSWDAGVFFSFDLWCVDFFHGEGCACPGMLVGFCHKALFFLSLDRFPTVHL